MVEKPQNDSALRPLQGFGPLDLPFQDFAEPWSKWEHTGFSVLCLTGLEFDPANAHQAHKDNTSQKRTLAYVYLEDGALLNAEIIRQGFGFALTRYPFSRMEEFDGWNVRREQRRGLWKAD
jgi:hypothetical protein